MLKDKINKLFESSERKKTFTTDEAQKLADELGWKGDVEEFRKGLDIEREHGLISPATNITDDDPIMTAKITMAHLNEIKDYNTRLLAMEKEAKGKDEAVHAEMPFDTWDK